MENRQYILYIAYGESYETPVTHLRKDKTGELRRVK
jgi:hypothetical protein